MEFYGVVHVWILIMSYLIANVRKGPKSKIPIDSLNKRGKCSQNYRVFLCSNAYICPCLSQHGCVLCASELREWDFGPAIYVKRVHDKVP